MSNKLVNTSEFRLLESWIMAKSKFIFPRIILIGTVNEGRNKTVSGTRITVNGYQSWSVKDPI
jgi:hypothetical protein